MRGFRSEVINCTVKRPGKIVNGIAGCLNLAVCHSNFYFFTIENLVWMAQRDRVRGISSVF